MRWFWVVVLVFSSGVSLAQDTNNPDELKKSLADALNQLKSAQDRKNELAVENEKLKAKITEQEQELTKLRKDAADFADKTWTYRAREAAWETFVKRYPNLLNRWHAFLETEPLSQPSLFPDFTDPSPRVSLRQ